MHYCGKNGQETDNIFKFYKQHHDFLSENRKHQLRKSFLGNQENSRLIKYFDSRLSQKHVQCDPYFSLNYDSHDKVKNRFSLESATNYRNISSEQQKDQRACKSIDNSYLNVDFASNSKRLKTRRNAICNPFHIPLASETIKEIVKPENKNWLSILRIIKFKNSILPELNK